MTFSVLLIKDDQRRVVGTLWTDNEASAQSLAPAVCPCAEGELLNVRRTEDREIPLRLEDRSLHFC